MASYRQRIEEIGGDPYDAWLRVWAEDWAAVDWAELAASLKPTVDRLKLLGALEPEFEL